MVLIRILNWLNHGLMESHHISSIIRAMNENRENPKFRQNCYAKQNR